MLFRHQYRCVLTIWLSFTWFWLHIIFCYVKAIWAVCCPSIGVAFLVGVSISIKRSVGHRFIILHFRSQSSCEISHTKMRSEPQKKKPSAPAKPSLQHLVPSKKKWVSKVHPVLFCPVSLQYLYWIVSPSRKCQSATVPSVGVLMYHESIGEPFISMCLKTRLHM